jgi:hypothetical protein
VEAFSIGQSFHLPGRNPREGSSVQPNSEEQEEDEEEKDVEMDEEQKMFLLRYEVRRTCHGKRIVACKIASFGTAPLVRRCTGTSAGLGYWKVGLEWPCNTPSGQ